METTVPLGRRFSPWFAGAAAISVFTAAIHGFVGTPEIMRPVFASALPSTVAAALDVLWHHATLLLIGAAIAFGIASARLKWEGPVAVLVGGSVSPSWAPCSSPWAWCGSAAPGPCRSGPCSPRWSR